MEFSNSVIFNNLQVNPTKQPKVYYMINKQKYYRFIPRRVEVWQEGKTPFPSGSRFPKNSSYTVKKILFFYSRMSIHTGKTGHTFV